MQRLNPVYLVLAAFCLLLTGCVSSGGGSSGRTWDYNAQNQTAEQPPSTLEASLDQQLSEQASNPSAPKENFRPVKVALLLPLSGEHAQLGQSMLKAAQMALFDVGYENFELMPKDTGSNPATAATAARTAIAEGAELILGPVFADSVKAVKPVAQGADINVIAFSTDWALAGGNTFIMGFLPFDQVDRVARFAAKQNIKKVGVLAPQAEYGNISLSAWQSMSSRAGIQTAQVERFNAQGSDLPAVIRRFSKMDERNAAPSGYSPAPYDAVFMPVGGDSAKTIGSMMTQAGLPPTQVRRLGTGLFDDQSLTQEPGLEGAWFAAPAPQARQAFEQRFMKSYNYTPPRLTTLAYDATALAAILAKQGLAQGDKPAFDTTSISNPNGFSGIDGIFRFRPDATAERGLAILEIKRGRIVVIDPAPKTFQPYAPY